MHPLAAHAQNCPDCRQGHQPAMQFDDPHEFLDVGKYALPVLGSFNAVWSGSGCGGSRHAHHNAPGQAACQLSNGIAPLKAVCAAYQYVRHHRIVVSSWSFATRTFPSTITNETDSLLTACSILPSNLYFSMKVDMLCAVIP